MRRDVRFVSIEDDFFHLWLVFPFAFLSAVCLSLFIACTSSSLACIPCSFSCLSTPVCFVFLRWRSAWISLYSGILALEPGNTLTITITILTTVTSDEAISFPLLRNIPIVSEYIHDCSC
jgi:hypothetical protein